MLVLAIFVTICRNKSFKTGKVKAPRRMVFRTITIQISSVRAEKISQPAFYCRRVGHRRMVTSQFLQQPPSVCSWFHETKNSRARPSKVEKVYLGEKHTSLTEWAISEGKRGKKGTRVCYSNPNLSSNPNMSCMVSIVLNMELSVFIRVGISQANEWEEYSSSFGKGWGFPGIEPPPTF